MFRSLVRVGCLGTIVGTGLCLTSCVLPEEPDVQNESGMVLRQVQAHSNSYRSAQLGGGQLVLDFQHADERGRSTPCKNMDLQVSVEYAEGGVGGAFVPLAASDVKVSCDASSPFNLGIVVDNSGSQAEVLEEVRKGASDLARSVIASGGKVSLTRVSTQASNLVGLTEDVAAIQGAIDKTNVNNGWTALYDGIRLAYEGLGQETLTESKKGPVACRRARRTAVAVFTDGADNNSADEKNDKGSDGLATTIGDLGGIRQLGVQVPVFAIGMGDKVNREVLDILAKESGGMHFKVDDPQAVGLAFNRISDALKESVEVCAQLPVTCGEVGLRVTYSYMKDGERVSATETFSTEVECPIPALTGRVANIFMALSDPSLPQEFASKLVANAAQWATEGRDNKILLVLDDNHHFESPGELSFLQDQITQAGYEVTVLNEPKQGLRPADIKDFSTVWFTNPGYPMDDFRTAKTLKKHVSKGNALILSGDDMSRANARCFDPSVLTRVNYIANGHRTCGVRTDNGSEHGYQLQGGDFSHPVTQGLDFTQALYRNDIDHAWPLHPEKEVLAWGRVTNGDCVVTVPVITAHDFK